MKKIVNKLKSKKAETLVETLVSVLVVAIASALFLLFVNTSTKLNAQAKVANNEVKAEKISATAGTWDKSGEVKIKAKIGTTTKTYTVHVLFNTDDSEDLRTYRLTQDGGRV